MRRAAGLLVVLLAAGCASRGSVKVFKTAPPRPTPEAFPGITPHAASATAQALAQLSVGKGDTLWWIARRSLGSGFRYPEIAALNSLADPDRIEVGQALKLPPGARLDPGKAAAGAKALPREKWTKRVNRAYAVGEKLTFAVQYFKLTGGYATLTVTEMSGQQGRPCLHVVAEAKSLASFEWIIKVRDRIETFIDAEALIPWRYEKHLREGGYSADAFYIFDQRSHKMLEPDKGKSADILPETQDVLSCFYWFRTMDLKVGDSSWIKVAADDMKSYDLKIDVLRKERVSTLAGDFDCILVQPHLQFEGVFQQKGDIFIWITDDERRIPVKIKSKIALGSINLNLQDAEWVQPSP